MFNIQKTLFLLFCLTITSILYSQNTIEVSSVLQMQTAINNATASDVIVLANGTYLNNILNIGKSNITVKAATPGGVFLNGTNDINITGNYITFSGFQFTSGNIADAYVIEVSGSHNVLTQLNFNGYYAKKYFHIKEGTQYNEITYCNIENKPLDAVIGCTIQITTSPTVPGYHKIRYCTFKNFPGLGGDYGNEPIRIGLSTEMTNVSRTVVEFCYFNNVGLGDGESISLKSSENVCRYNTFTNNPKGMLVFRHGYRNVAYGNFFINGSGGIRIKEGGDHYIYNNYFETGSADAFTLQYVLEFPLNNINIVHNTFVNSGPIDLGGTGPLAVTFANNIFKKSAGNIFTNTNSGTSWAGNIYQGNLGISIPTGATNIDPLLVLNSDKYYGLSALSPAIDASSSSYPAMLDIANVDDDPSLLLDISGQTRPATQTLKDVGCDEFTTGTTSNHPLVLSDVGPSYLGGPGSKLNQLINFNTLPSKTVGDADFSPGATASSGLMVSYSSSNNAVATIADGKIHIIGAGTSTITASQTGDATYNAAANVNQLLTVIKKDQTITFAELPAKLSNDVDFSPGAVSSSALSVSYSSSNESVASIVNGNLHIVGEGTSTITASQAGDAVYNPAIDVTQNLTVTLATSIFDSKLENLDFVIYPNPVSTVVNFKFNVIDQSNISLKICNLKGETVKTIINNEHLSKGIYEQTYYLSDLNEGLYFVSLKSENKSKTIKMTIIK